LALALVVYIDDSNLWLWSLQHWLQSGVRILALALAHFGSGIGTLAKAHLTSVLHWLMGFLALWL
jgi:hypothetical protein